MSSRAAAAAGGTGVGWSGYDGLAAALPERDWAGSGAVSQTFLSDLAVELKLLPRVEDSNCSCLGPAGYLSTQLLVTAPTSFYSRPNHVNCLRYAERRLRLAQYIC